MLYLLSDSEIWGSRGKFMEIYISVIRCYTVSIGTMLPTFRRNVVSTTYESNPPRRASAVQPDKVMNRIAVFYSIFVSKTTKKRGHFVIYGIRYKYFCLSNMLILHCNDDFSSEHLPWQFWGFDWYWLHYSTSEICWINHAALRVPINGSDV
jgi:hypothetical protein